MVEFNMMFGTSPSGHSHLGAENDISKAASSIADAMGRVRELERTSERLRAMVREAVML